MTGQMLADSAQGLGSGTPLFTSWGQVAVFVVAVAAAVGWLWRILKDGKPEPRPSPGRGMTELAAETAKLAAADAAAKAAEMGRLLSAELATTRQHLHGLIDASRQTLIDDMTKTRHDIRAEVQRLTGTLLEQMDKEFLRMDGLIRASSEMLIRELNARRKMEGGD